MVLHTAWQWTGDRALIEQHLPVAERCLTWIDEYGDRDGDGVPGATRPARPPATRTWAGRIPATACCTRTAPSSKAQGAVRIAGLCLRRMARHGGDLRGTRQPGTGAGADPQGRRVVRAFQRGVLERGTRSTPLRSTATKSRCCRSRPIRAIACGPGSSEGSGRTGGGAADGAGHVLRLGHSHAVCRPPRVQPVLVPQWLGVAARQQPDRDGVSNATGSPRRPDGWRGR